jgi:putative membrane protein
VTEPDLGTDRESTRFPSRVYRHGTEPDARFTLANERTFLAWIRTALALIASGVALEAFVLPIEPQLRLSAALVLVLLGILTPIQAWLGWMGAEKALRLNQPLPAPALAVVIGIGVIVSGLLIGFGLVFA